jgi:hypothetical protein
VLAALGFTNSSPYPATIDSSFLIATQITPVAGWGVALSYFSQGAAGAINPTWGFNAANGTNYSVAAVIVSIKP